MHAHLHLLLLHTNTDTSNYSSRAVVSVLSDHNKGSKLLTNAHNIRNAI